MFASLLPALLATISCLILILFVCISGYRLFFLLRNDPATSFVSARSPTHNHTDQAYRLENPDGIHYDIGFDFINAAMDAAPLPTGTGVTSTSTSTSTSGAADPTSSAESSWHTSERGRGRMTLQNPIGLVIQTLRILWGDIF
ncbi:hypothetical protein E4U28_006006 [Claviceps purpurea]|nr:hypothetical protein E4U28_006006 [Claviceps purpurea]